MNSKQIECFFNVVKYLNFTEAAEKMFTSQSNISRYISQLEEELGLTLFTRGNNYVRLTPSGSVMYSAFEQMNEFLNEQKKFARYTEKGQSGYLKIGFISFMDVEKFFMNILSKFREKYPNIIIDYVIEKDNIDVMTNKNIDLILTHEFDAPSAKNFLSKRICYSQMYLLYGKNHRLFNKNNVSITDFKEEKIWTINCCDTPSRSQIVERIMHSYGIKAYTQEATEDFDNALLQISMGNGVALLDFLTYPQISDSFRTLPIDKEIYRIGIDIVWNKNNLNPAISLFTKIIPECESL